MTKTLFRDISICTKNFFELKFNQSLFVIVAAFSVLVFTLGFSSVYATSITCTSPCIVYDYQSTNPQTWYYIGHGAVINITDNNAPHTTIQATITSSVNNDQFTFPLTYAPDPANPNTFQSPWINFTHWTNAANYQLHVAIGYTVTVSYDGATPQTANIRTSQEQYPIPTNYPPQPLTTVVADCTKNGGDQDGDFICENWEDQTAHSGSLLISFTDSKGIKYVYTMYCGTAGPGWSAHQTNRNAPWDPLCPDTKNKDIYIQVDWMKRHSPSVYALNNVTHAFANNGVALHIQLGNEVPHYQDITSPPSPGANYLYPTDFDKIKRWWFGTAYERDCPDIQNKQSVACSNEIKGNLTAKRQVFHYALFAHSQTGLPPSSGRSEQLGNDIGIYLGNFTAAVGSLDQQQGTLMHELGHNLNLFHGGSAPPDPNNPEYDNCKPNYLSVMSYTRQFAESYPINRALNYSEGFLSSLDKSSLNECAGVTTSGRTTSQKMVYAYPPNNSYRTTPIVSGGAIDWNSDNVIQGVTNCPPNNANIAANINNFSPAIPVCNSPFGAPNNILNDFNDWANLNFNLRANSNFYDGSPAPTGPTAPTVNCSYGTNPDGSCVSREITTDDVTGIRVSRVMDLYHAVTDNNQKQMVIQIANLVQQKQLYAATASLLQLRPQLQNNPNALPILDGILSSFKIANTVPEAHPDQSPPVSCDDRWQSIAPLKQYQMIYYNNQQTLVLSNNINNLINSLHYLGCKIPDGVQCGPYYNQVITNLGLPVCVTPQTYAKLVDPQGWFKIPWRLATSTEPAPKCPFGTKSDGTCVSPPIGNCRYGTNSDGTCASPTGTTTR